MSRLTSLWRNLVHRNRLERDLDDELRATYQLLVSEKRQAGMQPAEARRAAMLEIGGVEAVKEQVRDARAGALVDELLRDVRYSARLLRRNPLFTLTVVLTLALGIGANSAVFSAINSVLLRPLPFPDGDRLMRLSQTQKRTSEGNIAPVRLEEWNQLNSTFEAMTGYFAEDVSETSGDLPEKVRRASVAPRFFAVWGVMPALGRGFAAADHQEGAPPIVVISDRFWRGRFRGDPSVLGRLIRVDSQSFSIAGVMPGSFRFPDREVDLWLPRIYDRFAQSRVVTWYVGIGRLKSGVRLDEARANLAVVQAQLAEQYPDTDREIGARIMPLKESLVGSVRGSLWLLFGAVSVLALIACTNIAALLLFRGVRRQQEMSVRRALGASRAAIVRQTLTETAILALTGTLVGLLVAAAASAALRATGMDLPRMDEVRLDGRILFYTLGCVVAVTVLCGLWPAVRSIGPAASGTLAEAGRTQVSARHSIQWVLVGVQVALSVTLLAGAGLLIRSFQELSRVDPGFEPSRVLSFRVSASWAESGNRAGMMQMIDRLLDGLRALPGVESAATSSGPPGVPTAFELEFHLVEGRAPTEPRMLAESRVVSPGYFATMRIPLVAGELCRQQAVGAPDEVMVNRSFANRYLSGSSVIGLHLRTVLGSPGGNTIVGVVADVRELGIDRDPTPTLYSCHNPEQPFRVFLVRTRGEPAAIAQAVRLKMKELEPLRSVYDIAPLEAQIDDAFAQHRLRTLLLSLFAGTALSLACVGLYGTLSYIVILRRREVGLRIALGARRSDIAGHYLLKGLRVVGLACAAGLALSLVVSRFLSGMLFGVSPYDPATLSAVVPIVLLVAALASLLPAVRAALVEPMQVLRDE